MKRNSTPFFTLCAAVVLAAALLPDVGNAKFMRGESIPVERLIHNLEVVVKNEPNNIEAIYTLGRLHSLAFTQGSQEIEVFTKSFKDRSILKVPRIGRSSNPKSTFNESINLFPDKAMMHLAESLKFYKNAVHKAPQNALYSLSYAWVLDVGAVYAKDVKAPFLSADMPNAAEYQWKSEALRYYRNAYTISKERDGRNDRLIMGGDVVVSFEAAEAILKSFEGKILSKSEMEGACELAGSCKESPLLQNGNHAHHLSPQTFRRFRKSDFRQANLFF